MSEKSRLEIEIENKEATRKPLSCLILIALLSIALGALGVYAYKLKQDISIHEEEKVLIEQEFKQEKTDLLDRIEKLKKRRDTLQSDLKRSIRKRKAQ